MYLPYSFLFGFKVRSPARWPRECWLVLHGFLLTAALLGDLPAQELRHQPHPLSTYLDLRPAAPGSTAQTAPSWVEALEFIPASKAPADISLATELHPQTAKSVFRIRVHKPARSASSQLQARVFFDDRTSGDRPELTLWNELGEPLLPPVTLGQNLGLPSSENLTLPMEGVDYIEIETDGDGSQVRGLFLSWLESAEVLQPSDFASTEKVRQPFQILSSTRKRKNDSYLYGVVNATLQTGKPVVLNPSGNASVSLQFELERQPLMAVVSYEVLGAPVDAPPNVTVNGHPQGASSLYLPDLADPGFRGESQEGTSQIAFRYTGWLHAQKTIPGELLVAGLNDLTMGLSNGTDAVAIRSVSIQLKYDWEKLDYVLAPATPVSNENP